MVDTFPVRIGSGLFARVGRVVRARGVWNMESIVTLESPAPAPARAKGRTPNNREQAQKPSAAWAKVSEAYRALPGVAFDALYVPILKDVLASTKKGTRADEARARLKAAEGHPLTAAMVEVFRALIVDREPPFKDDTLHSRTLTAVLDCPALAKSVRADVRDKNAARALRTLKSFGKA